MHLPPVILSDELAWEKLLPFTYTRPVSDIRIGIFTIKEKWDLHLGVNSYAHTQPYLQSGLGILDHNGAGIHINAAVLPDESLAESIQGLQPGEMIHDGEHTIAWYAGGKFSDPSVFNKILYSETVHLIHNWWDIFDYNAREIKKDFFKITVNRKSQNLTIGNTLLGNPALLFLEEGARVHASVFNMMDGPIYVGQNAEIMEGSLLRGPISIGNEAVIKMGAKIYPGTTIGPFCKIGGEINNSIIHSYTNKAHDGFLGNSVIGSWCNLGADTNNSNLKNNYGEVEVYSYKHREMINSHKQFCGILMSDHNKCGINTMFNTGTVIGPCSNIFGAGFTPKHIPAFTWGGINYTEEHDFEKAMEAIHRMMLRRNIVLHHNEKQILNQVFSLTSPDRIA